MFTTTTATVTTNNSANAAAGLLKYMDKWNEGMPDYYYIELWIVVELNDDHVKLM